MMKYPPSQDEVFQSFKKWLEKKINITLCDSDIAKPDTKNRRTKDIDYCIDKLKIAVEISFSRYLNSNSANEHFSFFTEIISSKKAQLKKYKNQQYQTYLVVYNTFHPAISKEMVQTKVSSMVADTFANIDYMCIVSGNPPDDGWVDELNLPGCN